MIPTEAEYLVALDDIDELNARCHELEASPNADLLTVLNIHKALAQRHSEIHRYLANQLASSDSSGSSSSPDLEDAN